MFKPAASTQDPELQAMEYRQAIAHNGISARDRALAAQKGVSLAEPSVQISQTPVPRKNRMQAEFTHQSKESPAQDFSLQPPATTTAPLSTATPTRSSRRVKKQVLGTDIEDAEPVLTRWTHVHGIPPWDSPLTYPATGPKRTTVEARDFERLDDGEFLNDNLISFYLRYLEEHNADFKDQVHIFNTFFYTSLSTNKAGKKGFNYDAVKRWTRNIDLFAHPFVAVPINVNLHWFLVIICNLDKLEKYCLGEVDKEGETIETESTQSQSTDVKDGIEIPESPPQIIEGAKVIALDASQESDLPSPGKLKPVSRKGGKKPNLPKIPLNKYV